MKFLYVQNRQENSPPTDGSNGTSQKPASSSTVSCSSTVPPPLKTISEFLYSYSDQLY